MKNLGHEIDLPIQVYGPEINMTAIVGMALGEDTSAADSDVVLPPHIKSQVNQAGSGGDASKVLFTNKTRAIIFGRQFVAAQVRFGLDFINVLRTAFTPVVPQSVRNQSSHQYLFTLLGPTSVKAVRRTLINFFSPDRESSLDSSSSSSSS